MRLAPPGTLAMPRRSPRPRAAPAPGRAERASPGDAAGRLEDRHTRRVALLKRVLPASGVALLLLIAVWPRLAPLWQQLRFAIPAIDLRDARELRMINPRYAGIDRNGHPFVVIAAVGRQVPDRQDLMSLKAPRADIKMHNGTDVVVTADTGVYQQQVQLLDLFGHVTVARQDGNRFVTDRARADVAHDTAEGNDPVSGHGPSGDIKAQGFRILDKGDTILFTGRSDLLLRSARPGKVKSTPAALPAPVAETAALIAAQAKPLLAAARPGSAKPQRAVLRRPATRHPATRHPAARHPAARRHARHVRRTRHHAARHPAGSAR